jgi:hypothetical protein
MGQSQSNWKDVFQFCYAGYVIPRAYRNLWPGQMSAWKVWVIMMEEFCYYTVSDNTALFPNNTFQILSD